MDAEQIASIVWYRLNHATDRQKTTLVGMTVLSNLIARDVLLLSGGEIEIRDGCRYHGGVYQDDWPTGIRYEKLGEVD